MSAAEAGLFPKLEYSRRYPQTFPYSRITLNYFEKRNYSLHTAKKTDLPELIKLEEACWAGKIRVKADVLLRRIDQFPEGQLVVKMDERIVGVIYTQKICNTDELEKTPFQDILKLHDSKGNIIQLLSINVFPEMQNSGLGHQLINFVLWWVSLMGGVDKVVGVTRCKSYLNSPHLSMDEYVKQHVEHSNGIDQILRFHTSNGAKVKTIIPNYRPEDEDNNGAGVLIEYSIRDHKVNNVESTANTITNTSIADNLHECVKKLLSDKTISGYSADYALREMGFDSLRLLELRTLVNQKFNIKLDPTFFFEYGTPAAIIEYLQQNVSAALLETYPSESSEQKLAFGTTLKNEGMPASVGTSANMAEPIAIIGMACRFADGIKNSNDFWELLKAGKSAITPVPENRKQFIGESLSHGGFLNDVDKFDASFFHITPREAELMDPQQRILLEVCWEALEYAGINASKLKETNTGAFVGMFSHDYESLLSKSKKINDVDAYFATGNSESVTAGRLSYVLGLQGPAIAINTACSSSLVAVHLACQSLRLNECSIALAAAANLILSPELNIAFTNAGMLSPDGKCKTFDDAANGYVRSEGCGVIVLKKLSEAIADEDTILAIIKSTAINQDGASNGLTAPNKAAQESLLNAALKSANLAPHAISYIEAHGTGTSLGDPIEVKAISSVYANERDLNHPLMLGSVKTNIGHTEAVAGMAGLIKTILMLQHKKIPANVHFSRLNSHISLDHPYFSIPKELMDWTISKEMPLRAGISSFGFSGTNSHVILEEAPNISIKTYVMKPAYLFTLSANTTTALKQKIVDMMQLLSTQLRNTSDNKLLQKISYTLNTGRAHFKKRCAIVASSILSYKKH